MPSPSEKGESPRLPYRNLSNPRPTHVDARPREVRRPEHESPEAAVHSNPPTSATPETGRLNLAWRIASSIRFPFDGFTYFLTLFSKFFSSFPHGTCSLSVSRRYLALDGVYHPFWAAFPNNPTLRKHIVSGRGPPQTGLSPSVTCCSKQLRRARSAEKALLEITTRRCRATEISNLSSSRFTRRYWGNPC